MLEKFLDVIAERAAQIVMRRLLKEGGADVVLNAVGQKAAYRFLVKHGWGAVDSELFRTELDRQMFGSFSRRNNAGSDAR